MIPPRPFIQGQTVHLACEAESDVSEGVMYQWRLPRAPSLLAGQAIDWVIPAGLEGLQSIICIASNRHGCSQGKRRVQVLPPDDWKFEQQRLRYIKDPAKDVAPLVEPFSCDETSDIHRTIGCTLRASDPGKDFLAIHWSVELGAITPQIKPGGGLIEGRYWYAYTGFLGRTRHARIQANVTDYHHHVFSNVLDLELSPQECRTHAPPYEPDKLEPIFWDHAPLRVNHLFRPTAEQEVLESTWVRGHPLVGVWDATEGALACQRRILACAQASAFREIDGCALGALRCKGEDPSKGDPAGDDCCPEACIHEYFRLRSMRTVCENPLQLLDHAILESGHYPGTAHSCLALEIP